MDLNVYVPPQNARFGTFLELIQQLNTFANQETVLVVNHGMSDQNDDPLGLILPLTSGSAKNPEEYSLGLLAGFIAKPLLMPSMLTTRRTRAWKRLSTKRSPCRPEPESLSILLCRPSGPRNC
jgi:hypothetical protein